MTKSEIRASMRLRLSAVSDHERDLASAAVCERVRDLVRQLAAPLVAFYAAANRELNLAELLPWFDSCGVRTMLPRRAGASYEMARFHVGDDLVTGPYGIQQPAEQAERVPQSDSVHAVWLVPGVAFGRNGARVGHGGGYYDQLLAAVTGPRVAIAYDCQILSFIPMEQHDVPMTHFITQTSLLKIQTES